MPTRKNSRRIALTGHKEIIKTLAAPDGAGVVILLRAPACRGFAV